MSFTLRCMGCKKNVAGRKDAVIHIKYNEVLAAEQAFMEETWQTVTDVKNGDHLKITSAAELIFDAPKDARWKIHCDDCNPHWTEDRTDCCDGCYWWSLDRCKTAVELLHWTAHLHQSKSWFAATNWDDLLYSIPEVANADT